MILKRRELFAGSIAALANALLPEFKDKVVYKRDVIVPRSAFSTGGEKTYASYKPAVYWIRYPFHDNVVDIKISDIPASKVVVTRRW